MIERSFDAGRLNAIVNHPAVYEFVKGHATGPLDTTDIVNNPANVLLMGEHGGVIFIALSPGIYEAHTQVLPEGRGRWTIEMVRAALTWMFTRSEAVEILTKVPKGNLAARALTKSIGGRFEFRAHRGWVVNGETVHADVFSLTIQEWMAKAPELPAVGHWFHDRLTAEYARLGKTEDLHADDETHDRYVGAAVCMLLGGQPHKAIIFYNRWASMSGYQPLDLVSLNPVTVDIRDALCIVRGDDFYVAAVRNQLQAA